MDVHLALILIPAMNVQLAISLIIKNALIAKLLVTAPNVQIKISALNVSLDSFLKMVFATLAQIFTQTALYA
jgi:hypothetical protein